MTAQQFAGTRVFHDLSVVRLLEGLARVHRWILVVDAQRRILWTSEAMSEIQGLDDLAPGMDARHFVSTLPRPEQVFPLRSNLRGRRHLTHAPLELRTREGCTVPVELDLVRIDSEAGELLVVIARPRASATTRQGGSDLDARLVDAAPDAILAIDADGFVRRANPAAGRLLDRAPERLEGRAASMLLAERAEDVEALSRALARPDECGRCEISVRRPDGSHLVLAIRVARMEHGERAVFLRDVTDERHGELELRKANDELEHCVNALAHDLRSPLVALLGFSRLLRQDYGVALDDTGSHYLDRIEQAARTMESLIHDLLELARIGELGERPSLVDPRKVLLQISAEFKPRLDEAGIDLVLPGASTPLVYCDHSRLYQVFSNLIGNAIDHMGPCDDPRIEVRVEESEHTHEIVVSDNGRGVSFDNRERIFEIFQSLGTRAGGGRGTGMGLAIVKKIAEKHGGRVWLESEPGRGARFHVSLPRR